jgi:hypothetical protein
MLANSPSVSKLLQLTHPRYAGRSILVCPFMQLHVVHMPDVPREACNIGECSNSVTTASQTCYGCALHAAVAKSTMTHTKVAVGPSTGHHKRILCDTHLARETYAYLGNHCRPNIAGMLAPEILVQSDGCVTDLDVMPDTKQQRIIWRMTVFQSVLAV